MGKVVLANVGVETGTGAVPGGDFAELVTTLVLGVSYRESYNRGK
jgi:hypothetical protein